MASIVQPSVSLVCAKATSIIDVYISGQPRINALLSAYTDLTMDADSPALARLECHTMDSPPTTVTWKRDGVAIDAGSSEYKALQIVVDRENSHYRNILYIVGAFEIMGSHNFTCEIENIAGSTTHTIAIDIPGIILIIGDWKHCLLLAHQIHVYFSITQG